MNVNMEITFDPTEINDPTLCVNVTFSRLYIILYYIYVTVCLVTYYILSYIFFRAEV